MSTLSWFYPLPQLKYHLDTPLENSSISSSTFTIYFQNSNNFPEPIVIFSNPRSHCPSPIQLQQSSCLPSHQLSLTLLESSPTRACKFLHDLAPPDLISHDCFPHSSPLTSLFLLSVKLTHSFLPQDLCIYYSLCPECSSIKSHDLFSHFIDAFSKMLSS